MEDLDWIFCTVWDKEDGVESSQGTRYSGWGATVSEEV